MSSDIQIFISERRIGNFFRHSYGIVKLVGFKETTNKDLGHEDYVPVDHSLQTRIDPMFDYPQGIGIDNFFLVELGFTSNGKTGYQLNNVLVSHSSNDNFWSVYYLNEDKPSFKAKVENIHELQNVYFKITGEDLKYSKDNTE